MCFVLVDSFDSGVGGLLEVVSEVLDPESFLAVSGGFLSFAVLLVVIDVSGATGVGRVGFFAAVVEVEVVFGGTGEFRAGGTKLFGLDRLVFGSSPASVCSPIVTYSSLAAAVDLGEQLTVHKFKNRRRREEEERETVRKR